jgi:hypothetical protein
MEADCGTSECRDRGDRIDALTVVVPAVLDDLKWSDSSGERLLYGEDLCG